MDYVEEIRMPHERVAILIGKKGEIKQEIEEATGMKIEVNSHEGDVTISGNDPLALLSTKDIVKAIARGFNPHSAMQLVKQDFAFELIYLTEFLKTKNDMLRLKGRVIGQEGKSRRIIEDLTQTQISVYGKTIGIIGRVEDVPLAKRAIDSLLQGSPHSKVYKWLEKQRRDRHKQEIVGKSEPLSDAE